jgi:hypothetical protein
MGYKIELEYIPMGTDRAIVLAGMHLRDSSYAVKIGLFPGELDRETRMMDVSAPVSFQYLALMYATQRGSIFDTPTERVGRIASAEVKFSESERFANGTETLFTAFNLKTVLRTILPHDGGITVLQFMVKRHGQSIGLMTFGNADRYVSTVYDVIGGPLVEDKKGLD